MATRILKADEFITNIGIGQGVIKVYPPSIPKKLGLKNQLFFWYFISFRFDNWFIICFYSKVFSRSKNLRDT